LIFAKRQNQTVHKLKNNLYHSNPLLSEFVRKFPHIMSWPGAKEGLNSFHIGLCKTELYTNRQKAGNKH
jgi:hypothetical protein